MNSKYTSVNGQEARESGVGFFKASSSRAVINISDSKYKAAGYIKRVYVDKINNGKRITKCKDTSMAYISQGAGVSGRVDGLVLKDNVRGPFLIMMEDSNKLYSKVLTAIADVKFDGNGGFTASIIATSFFTE